MMASSEYVLLDKRGDGGRVGVIILNRPDRANAMIPAMAEALHQAIVEANADRNIRALIVTGAGKHFCPGMDGEHAAQIAERMAAGTPPAEPFDGNLRHLHAATLALFESPKATVAAINGATAAGGLDIAAACDYRVASSRATFAESYVKVGLPPLNGGAFLLPRLVGEARAFRLLMGGERIDAATALDWRLVDELCSDEELLPRAAALAEQFTTASPALARFIKGELRQRASLADSLARAYVGGVSFVASEEYRAAVARLPRARK
jgi:enoyl-CoA hydratase/carnithine racemase